MLFAGNLIKHPCFDEMRKSSNGYRIVGNLTNANKIMNNSFWVGVYPEMTNDMINYMADAIKEAVNKQL
ncbi:dTDP-4-amino-4,6-dideoxygalactose transaminase [Clostridium beijerinckii]|nr:dTDP-4-amino-4,6-dideoxygalactose transaminase [Clostridium beijerinckii]